MTQRTVQFNMDFDVEGLSTIGQLEDELTNINDELKKVDINSDAFKQLSKQAATANGKLREIDSSLQGFTSDERSDSIKKLSEGLVGGFAAASSAAVLFGDDTSEAMQKAMQKAGALFVAADGIDKMFKAMSKTNIAAMKATVLGFKTAAIAAKNFAKTTRGALISTGIGALIVAVGVLIANFDKIVDWVVDVFPNVTKAFDKFKDIITGIGAAIKAAFRGEDIREAYKDAIESQHKLEESQEEYNKLVGEAKKQLDHTLELKKLLGATEEEILAAQKEYFINLVKITDELETQRELSDTEKENRDDAAFQIQKITVQEHLLGKEKSKQNAEELAAEKLRREATNKRLKEQAEIYKALKIEYDAKIKIAEIDENGLHIIDMETRAIRDKILLIEYEAKLKKEAHDKAVEFAESLNFYGQAQAELLYSIGGIYDGVAQRRRQDLDIWLEENKTAYETIAELENSLGTEKEELNNLLRDAEGDRYSDILAQIEAVNAAETVNAANKAELDKQEAERRNKIAQAEYLSAKADKASALISATVQGILAVIKALPNIPLSILTGLLAGAGVAAIAAQPLPPAPPKIALAEGGLLIGDSHGAGGIDINGEGGEFMTNKAATRAFLPLLEKINNAGKSMAEGGVVGQEAPALIAEQSDIFDYDKMAQAMASYPQFVSVVEFESVQNRLRVVEDRSSI